MPKSIAYIVSFGVGAVGYGLVELAWRGRTHWTMLVAGGICFVLVSRIVKLMEKSHMLYKCIAGSLIITLVEFIFGCAFNYNKNIWDYSEIPLNIAGQICLLYSVMWGFLSFLLIPAAQKVFEMLFYSNGKKIGNND